ncbi:MAG: hypothetical protein NWE95_12110 [Candidatus Bathyarchaeota archaeon]|nr:hypothetical protein [Candidatus Bathyarchaeota archaeon]
MVIEVEIVSQNPIDIKINCTVGGIKYRHTIISMIKESVIERIRKRIKFLAK